MSFRWRVSLFLVVALIVALLAQFALGFVLFRRALLADLQNDIQRHVILLSQHLTFTETGVELDDEGRDDLTSLNSYAEGRARVVTTTGSSYSLGAAFPNDTSTWLVQRYPLPNNATLEVAMNPSVHNSPLRSYLRANGIGLPLLSLLFIALTLLLAQRLIQPLRKLQQAVSHVTASAELTGRVPEPTTKDELGQLSRSYNQMMTRLEQFFERERTFTRYASHELRNPVAALRLQVDEALKGNSAPANVLPILKRELARLSDTLDGLLILAREQTLVGASLDFADLVRESLDRGRLLAVDKPLDLEYVGPRSVLCKGDAALLARMVDNLVENAVKYCPSGNVTLRLQANAIITLRVEDEGPGVPGETLEKLTQPFYRVKHVGPGTGLGLAVVKRVAELHGGSLVFELLQPKGFAAVITLPASNEAMYKS
jgi:signal transduction histidine kinase